MYGLASGSRSAAIMRTFTTCALALTIAVSATADTTILAARPSLSAEGLIQIQSKEIPNLGKVRITGRVTDGLLTIRATTSDGKVLAESQSPLGLAESELYVRVGEGFERIIIQWQDDPS
jgi:hypothetical protein